MSEQQKKADAAEQPAPSVGRIVHVEFASHDVAPGQSLVVPAMVVAVFGPSTVNVRVFHDGQGELLWLSSLERKDVVEKRAEGFKTVGAPFTRPRAVWFWPPRV